MFRARTHQHDPEAPCNICKARIGAGTYICLNCLVVRRQITASLKADCHQPLPTPEIERRIVILRARASIGVPLFPDRYRRVTSERGR